ncbi:DUF2249 domain-containing protein [Brevibacillus sp. SYSU BS000544]|uniref:DUF2249 domain-containing protein n=1 Tax=Brevibacillus sp. SYSU BS000544 TaxID=3416443 RepID=UPI003CE4BE7A
MSANLNYVELDVRPHLKKKLEPFEIIMEAVKKLQKDDVFVLHATFKPTPLLSVMKVKGFVNKVEQVDDEHWIVTFVHKSNSDILDEVSIPAPAPEETEASSPVSEGKVYTLDNRGLEPPQPMIRTLAQLDKMAPGDTLIITNDRVPVFLLEELNQLGYSYEVENLENDAARLTIKK